MMRSAPEERDRTSITPRDPLRLWLDDIRDPVRQGCVGWTWAKTAAEAIEWLKTGRVVEASLDHDLTISQTFGMSDSEDTGYTVACWMEEHGVWPRDGVRCHSTNPFGRQRIEAVIRNANQ